MGKEKEQKLTFEEAMETLETLVTEIEEGKVSLEESIEKYAEGTGLVKQCRAILDRAEKKIQVLSKGQDGALQETGELDEPEAPAES
jgi:exodeoxyribonuclease VII small subunit